MAITTYENRIPPSLEHLVWGGGYVSNNYRGYIGSIGYVITQMTSGSDIVISVLLIYLDDNYIYYGDEFLISAYHKVCRNRHNNVDNVIVISDTPLSAIRCTNKEVEYIQDMLPESWISAMSRSIINWNQIYKLPISDIV